LTRIRFATALSTATLLLVSSTAAAADRVQAGKWQTEVTVAGKPMRTEYCISAAEAKLMNGDVATLRKYLEQSTAEKTNGKCAVTKVAIEGNRTIVGIVCGKTEVVGTTSYFGNRYESATSDGSKVTGKRLGDCD
jgi:HAMP domain-containing protein